MYLSDKSQPADTFTLDTDQSPQTNVRFARQAMMHDDNRNENN